MPLSTVLLIYGTLFFLMWVFFMTIYVAIQSYEKRKYGRVLVRSDTTKPSEPISFFESPMYLWYERNQENIHHLPSYLVRQLKYTLQDIWSLLVNIFKTLTGQNKPIIVYREVKTTTVKQTIAKPEIVVKNKRTTIDPDSIIGEQKVLVNGKVLTKRIYKEEVKRKPKQKRKRNFFK